MTTTIPRCEDCGRPLREGDCPAGCAEVYDNPWALEAAALAYQRNHAA